MNGLDALAVAAKEGAGIVRVPSWQAEADLAAGHLVRPLAGY
jgi:DNA-binding transcriptional LysR family regulator